MCMCSVCVCVYVYIYVCIYIYINTYFMCTYIYVLNFPIFCAIWLKKCDFLTEKLGIKPDPDPKLFIPDPDPSKSSGSGSTTLLAPCPADDASPPWWLSTALSVSHCSPGVLGLQSCPQPSSELSPSTLCLPPAKDSRLDSQTPGVA